MTHCANAPGNQGLTTKWIGADSAGARIELAVHKGIPLSATVTDVVLGSAAAVISSRPAQEIAFKVVFSGGVQIEYLGHLTGPLSESTTIAGTWIQTASGPFGLDYGTWNAKSLEFP